MHLYSKALLVVAALFAIAPLAVAQAPPADSPASPDGSGMAPERGPGMPGGMHHGFARHAEFRHEDGEGLGRMRGPEGFSLSHLLANPDIREKLGVTAEQAAKIRQQESEYRKTRIRDRADMEIKRMELEDLLSAENPDRSLIEKKLREISEVCFASEKSAIAFHLDMRTALTPEQREKLKQMFAEFRRGHMDREFRGPGERDRGWPGGMHRHGPPPQGAPDSPAPPAKPPAPEQPQQSDN